MKDKRHTADFAAAKSRIVGWKRQAIALALSFAIVQSPVLAAVQPGNEAPKATKPVHSLTYFKTDQNGGGKGPSSGNSNGGCNLQSAKGNIKHVIYIQFDNVHFERDNPNVPSDLEQMPHLLKFLTQDGTLLTNSHTPLISHTSVDILTSLTGVYGDRHGAPIGNSFGYYPLPNTSSAPDLFDSTFTYWTDPVNSATPSADPLPIMLSEEGKNAPAPWVAYTRAGCNFGAVSIANMEFENITSDVFNVFPDSTSVANQEATAASQCTPSSSATCVALKTKAVADFEGIAVHCALGNQLCSTGNGGGPDTLPSEPNGYTGFNALYGHKFVVPAINNGNVAMNDLDGNVVTDASNPPNVGFPGFSGINAAQTLSYVAQMQENGVPVTFAYISDVHDNPKKVNANAPAACLTDVETGALGPGDVCHNALAAAYDEAFDKFFKRLAKDGITPANTLFAIMCEEQDHFAGGDPTPANCDGVNVPCSYGKLGEVDVNTSSLLTAEDPTLISTTPYDIHFDMAPVFYITGNPAQNADITRRYERDTANLTAVSPITGATDNLTAAMADLTEMKILHMLSADPQRNPSFVMFGNPDYFFQTTGSPAVNESPAFAYNHGGIQPEISTVWVGFVGPGVLNKGIDSRTFADETDYRPTMLSLLGLKDDYQHEGRLLSEELQSSALPNGVRGDQILFQALGDALKQINAPFGKLGKETLEISTVALKSNDAHDATYALLEFELSKIGSTRDALASRMLAMIEDAEFNGKPIRAEQALPLIAESAALLAYVHALNVWSTDVLTRHQ